MINSNKFVILETEAKNGDLIKVNQVNGIRYSEIWAAFEYPRHEEHPIIDDGNKVVGARKRKPGEHCS